MKDLSLTMHPVSYAPISSMSRVLLPILIAIDGVADVQLSGNRQRVLRVAVDPLRLTSYGLSVSDVAAALREAPFDVPAGSFRSEDQQLLVRADATVLNAGDVADIIVRDSIRIGDIANVYFGPEDATTLSRLNANRIATPTRRTETTRPTTM